MGIYSDCLKDRFHALISRPVPWFAGAYLSASQINIAGMPNVFAMAIFLMSDKRYCNIEGNSPYSRLPGNFAVDIKKGRRSLCFIA